VNKLKILLVCAGGASTSILMKKMEKYAADKGFELKIFATSMNEYEDYFKQYDLILLGPQISYKRNEVEECSKKPVAVITPYDYAIGNMENIFKLVDSIFPQKYKSER
jgi:PTS system cellobiose-specific IIB component